ncbi:hypothetical protein NECID01_1366 [Nematocida sp. AWRm77]|nr:hypothetical protein NECID01_1366 [Nematocida sp. AWRm77]
MRIVVDIHYFDYALYRFIECLLLPEVEEDSIFYYSKIIKIMKQNLDRKEYLMEEEMIAKYAIYLMYEKIFDEPLQEDAARQYCMVLKEMKKINLKLYSMEKIQLYLLWSYHYIVLGQESAQASIFSKLEEFESHELLAKILSEKPGYVTRAVGCESKQSAMHFISLKDLVSTEVEKTFRYFREPLLSQNWNIQEPVSYPKSEEQVPQDVDMIAAEFSTLYTTPRSIFPDMYEDILTPKPQLNVFDQNNSGQEISWREHSLEDMHLPNRMKPLFMHPEGSMEYKGTLVYDKDKKRRVWKQEEEERLIKGVAELGKDWKQIRILYDFGHLTSQQLKDKHRSLSKSGKIEK